MSGTLAMDRDALSSLGAATNKASWKIKQGWDVEDDDLDKWHGVTVDSFGRVRGVTLQNNKLSGTIPSGLAKLLVLTELDLSQNQLEGPIPRELCELVSVKILRIEHNALTGTLPKELSNLSTLVELSLGGNNLTGSIPAGLGKLRHLEILNLKWNRLTGMIPAELGKLSLLRSLKLGFNRLEGEIPPELFRLRFLVAIHLCVNQLTGSIPTEVENMANLKWLDLRQNRLTGTIPPELRRMGCLEHLWLQGNQLSGGIPADLGELRHLQSLILEGNKLVGVIPSALGGLSSLKQLDLSGNTLTGFIPPEIGDLPCLQLLNLASNHLIGPIPPSFGKLLTLAKLHLLGNKLCGPVPDTLANLTQLEWIFLGFKDLEGPAPTDLSPLDCLAPLGRLALGKNKLCGIPRDTADSLGTAFGIPPHSVAESGFQQIVRHYEALAKSGEAILNRLKVVMVGASRAGKTSLVRSLRQGAPRPTADWDRTIGVDIGRPWKLGATDQLELVFWDFGGHTDYHPTHRLFYTKWALYLLVIDLHKFDSDAGCRVDTVDSWLDALLSVVPGSAFLVVLTHTDLFGSSAQVAGAVDSMKKYIAAYLEDRRLEYKRSLWKRKAAARTRNPGSDVVDDVPMLVLCGIRTTSYSNPRDLEALQAEIVRVSTTAGEHSSEPLFPHVGQRVAKVWARAGAVMDALRSGADLLDSAGLGDAHVDARKGQKQLKFPAQNCVSLREISSRWDDVVQTLALQHEVGEGDDSTLEGIVTMKQQEGTMLQACGIMHLDPSWINKLLRCLTDHRLVDPGRQDWWRMELQGFIDAGRIEGPPLLLFQAHEEFRTTGRLSQDYLKFLWRDVDEIKADHDVLDSIIKTVSCHGVMLKSPASPASDGELLVPFRLPPEIDPSALDRLKDATCHGRRMRFTWDLGKHAPSDFVGLFLTQCLPGEPIQVHACWRWGLAFAMDDLEHLVCLHAAAAGRSGTDRTVSLELSVAAYGDSMALQTPAMALKKRLESTMSDFFPGIMLIPSANGEVTRGGQAWEGCFQQMREHLDFHFGRFGATLDAVMTTTRSALAKLTAIHDQSFAYPALVVMRPETEADREGRVQVDRDAWCSKRALRDMKFRIQGCYSKPMRLFFVCPYDFTEVPCGRDGAGYPFRMNNEWCRKLYPAMQATLAVARAACKVACGMDLPVSDFLGVFEGELTEELGGGTDSVVDQFVTFDDLEDAISAEMKAGRGLPDTAVHRVVGNAFESLQLFIEKQKADSAGGSFIEHSDEMRLCDDGEGGRVWVSLTNVASWNDRLDTRNPTVARTQGGGAPFSQVGTNVIVPLASAPPESPANLFGGETNAEPCAAGHSNGASPSPVVTHGDTPANKVGDSPVEVSPSAGGGCCVVS